MLEQKEKYKIIVMLILLAGACLLTYYFHAILETGMVFTHFFYIPVILAALWWRRKGLVVAVFLAALLIFSHIFVRAGMVTANDYLRAFMFIVIAFVVATLSEQIAKAHEKTAHLNAILSAIRNVNQLIVREKDRDRLIQRVCRSLIETRGYNSAWIALVDENGRFLTAAEAGLGGSFSQVVEMMKRGEFTWCGLNALKQSGIIIAKDVAADCADCPLVSTYSGRAGMAVRLEYRDRIYGVLSVSIPAEVAADADEQSLFNEVAGDIALALRDIELEEARKRAEEALRELNMELEERVKRRTAELEIANEQTKKLQKRLQLQIDRMPIGLIVWDTKFRAKTWNPAATKIFGFAEEEALGKHPYELIVPKEAQHHVDNIWRRLLEGDETAHSVNENITKDGRTIICEWLNTPLKEADGTVVGVLSMAQDITERKRAEEHIEHLHSVIKAIRNVNQLIIVEKDRDSLLQKACDVLIEARGYDAAWLIGFLSDGETFATVNGSGFREDFSRFREHLLGGERLPCLKNALAQKVPFMLVDKFIQCGDCFFKSAHADKEVAILRVEHAGRLFGLLTISLASDVAADKEEKGLLTEVAGDIAFGLHDIEMEEARKRVDEALKHTALSLQEHVEKLEESKKKIAEAYRLREHFLKETSHRIITPVSIIGGHTDLLLDRGNLDDAQKEKIRIIRERNEEVEKLVRDALAGKYLEEEEEGEG
ncbi:MAG: PAS domain S-box protein [Euryarchaeota archaeon]|nr:PAS domain S-box protein [Euryarchaeota archaeon]